MSFLSPKETICMKCQMLFSRKNKKNIIHLLSAELPHSMLSHSSVLCTFIHLPYWSKKLLTENLFMYSYTINAFYCVSKYLPTKICKRHTL